MYSKGRGAQNNVFFETTENIEAKLRFAKLEHAEKAAL